MVKQVGLSIKPKTIIFGIQGGKGSFNEEAIMHYIEAQGIKNSEVKYLYTSEKVLAALDSEEIDYGLFALHNSVGGIVEESVRAMGKYKFEVYCDVVIPIQHYLMKRKDADISEIDTIMTHPQVLAQCKDTLAKKYSNLKKTSGEGDLIDHSLVAKHMSEKKLSKNIAVMGSKILAQLYDLDIIEGDLQDNKHNLTSFLMVHK